MAFAFDLSPETRERMNREEKEAHRLYGLANAWLARELLNLARAAQRSAPHLSPEQPVYDSTLVYGIVPELARRLGTVRLETREINWEIRPLSDYALRQRAGYCLRNTERSFQPGWNILTREIYHGNPVVYAVDRLCPGKPGDRDDPIAQGLAEVSRNRAQANVTGHQLYAGVWTPAF